MRLFAPAKINLALHLLGRRADGYHLLDSLVGFATLGDWVDVLPADEWRLTVTGTFAAGVPTDERNLLSRARAAFEAASGKKITLGVELEKNLPHGAGLGGGSADAARLFFAMQHYYTPHMSEKELMEIATPLGGDMRAAMSYPRTAWLRMQGMGEQVEAVHFSPRIPAVLTHAGVMLSTPRVYGATAPEDFGEALPTWPARFDAEGAIAWLAKHTANHLMPAAQRLDASVAQQCAKIAAQSGCGLARMSGSGSACFGLFATEEAAQAAARQLQEDHPDWWVAPTMLGLPEGVPT